MSFDVDIRYPPVKLEGDEEPYVEWVGAGNYTSNLGAFFAWALQGVDSADPTARSDSRDALFGRRPTTGLVALNGLDVAMAVPLLQAALDRTAEAQPGSLDRFNAPNGWGSVATAVEFLRSIHRRCVEAPPGSVLVVSL